MSPGMPNLISSLNGPFHTCQCIQLRTIPCWSFLAKFSNQQYNTYWFITLTSSHLALIWPSAHMKLSVSIRLCKTAVSTYIGRTCLQPNFDIGAWLPRELILTSLWPHSGGLLPTGLLSITSPIVLVSLWWRLWSTATNQGNLNF